MSDMAQWTFAILGLIFSILSIIGVWWFEIGKPTKEKLKDLMNQEKKAKDLWNSKNYKIFQKMINWYKEYPQDILLSFTNSGRKYFLIRPERYSEFKINYENILIVNELHYLLKIFYEEIEIKELKILILDILISLDNLLSFNLDEDLYDNYSFSIYKSSELLDDITFDDFDFLVLNNWTIDLELKILNSYKNNFFSKLTEINKWTTKDLMKVLQNNYKKNVKTNNKLSKKTLREIKKDEEELDNFIFFLKKDKK